ncbi:hypothetical protein FQA39_LY13837 [Lamprigera yunnana]|nr:hypothetical protein FQA39_LY13837 [Lamprigera yunnana]
MFVSNMLKKCVNLLKYDFPKGNGKTECENVPPQKSLVGAIRDNSDLDESIGTILTQDSVNKLTVEEVLDLNSVINCKEKDDHHLGLSKPENVNGNQQINDKKPRPSILKNFDPLYSTDYVDEDLNLLALCDDGNTGNSSVIEDFSLHNTDECYQMIDIENNLDLVSNKNIAQTKDRKVSADDFLNITENLNLTESILTATETFEDIPDTHKTVFPNTSNCKDDQDKTNNTNFSLPLAKITDTFITTNRKLEENISTEVIFDTIFTEDLQVPVKTLSTTESFININNIPKEHSCLTISKCNSIQEFQNSTFLEKKLHNTIENLNCTERIPSPTAASRNNIFSEDDVNKTDNLKCTASETFKNTNECTEFEDNIILDASKDNRNEENKKDRITTKEVQMFSFKKMEELDKLTTLKKEVADLKLQLKASKQVQANLKSQLTQKDELIIESQKVSLKKHQSFKDEFKLREELEKKNSGHPNTALKELQETIKSLRLQETRSLNKLTAQKNNLQDYGKIIHQYEKTISTRVLELQELNKELDVLRSHFATTESVFSDVFQRYERCKKIIEGYKSNEDALCESLIIHRGNIIKSEEKYESLKAHAKTQIEKSNQELLKIREKYETELHKLRSVLKRLEIKVSFVVESLKQKSKECSALDTLYNDINKKT